MQPGLLASAYPKMFYSQGSYNVEKPRSYPQRVSRHPTNGYSTVARIACGFATAISLGIGAVIVTPTPANAAPGSDETGIMQPTSIVASQPKEIPVNNSLDSKVWKLGDIAIVLAFTWEVPNETLMTPHTSPAKA